MVTLRRRLGLFAVAGALVHALGAAAPAVTVWAASAADCTCTTGNHAICPMHHRASKTGCAIRAAADDGTAMLAPLRFIGVLAPAARTIPALTVATANIRFDDRSVSSSHAPPDPPPPRA